MTVMAAVVYIGAIVWVWWKIEVLVGRRRVRREATEVIVKAQGDLITSLTFDPVSGEPRPTIKPWTPAEREAFGINDTDRWIAHTEHELAKANHLRWNERAAEVLRLANGVVPTTPTPEIPDEDYAEIYAHGLVDPVRRVPRA